jgi:hypothetical protein
MLRLKIIENPCTTCAEKDYYPYEMGLCNVCQHKGKGGIM